MNRIYEELFIVKPDTAEEEADQFVEQLRTQLTTAGATVDCRRTVAGNVPCQAV